MLGWAALLPVGSAFGMAVLMIANRAVAGSTSALAAQMLAATICAPILWFAALLLDRSGVPALHIGTPSPALLLRIAGLAVLATVGHLLVYLATTRSSAARIAPTNYVQILFAVALGWIIFGDRPDLPGLAGMAMIIAAGLWLFQPDRIRR
jgi:drug/metabolite transporter (DMT)-like permease